MNSAITRPTSCDYLTQGADRRSLLTFLLILAAKRTATAETYSAYRTYTVVFSPLCRQCVVGLSVSSAAEWAVVLTCRDRLGARTSGLFSLCHHSCGGSGLTPRTAEISQMQNVKAPLWSCMSKSSMCNGWRVTVSLLFFLLRSDPNLIGFCEKLLLE